MWGIFKVFIEFVTVLILFYISWFLALKHVGCYRPDQGSNPQPPTLEGKVFKHWIAREVSSDKFLIEVNANRDFISQYSTKMLLFWKMNQMTFFLGLRAIAPFFAVCSIIIFHGISAKYLHRCKKNRNSFSGGTSQLPQEAAAFPPTPLPSSTKCHRLPGHTDHSKIREVKSVDWEGVGEVRQKIKLLAYVGKKTLR